MESFSPCRPRPAVYTFWASARQGHSGQANDQAGTIQSKVNVKGQKFQIHDAFTLCLLFPELNVLRQEKITKIGKAKFLRNEQEQNEITHTELSQRERKVIMANLVSSEHKVTMVNSLIRAASAGRYQQHNYGREKMDAGTPHTWQGAEGAAGGDGQALKMIGLAGWCPSSG